MKKLEYDTNINCSSCYAKVEDELQGKNIIEKFEVDFSKKNKPAVFYLKEGASEQKLLESINNAGYKAKPKSFFKKIFK